jgi:hypothetical protein
VGRDSKRWFGQLNARNIANGGFKLVEVWRKLDSGAAVEPEDRRTRVFIGISVRGKAEDQTGVV